MTPSTRDRISVDLRGLRGAVLMHAELRGVTPSDLVRGVLADALSVTAPAAAAPAPGAAPAAAAAAATIAGVRQLSERRVRLHLRVTAKEAREITAAASAAGLPLGTFVAGLVAGIPALAGSPSGTTRGDHIAALVASSARLSSLNRGVHRLGSLLRQGDVAAARPYRQMLDTLSGDVRAHLALASEVLTSLRPCRPNDAATSSSTPR